MSATSSTKIRKILLIDDEDITCYLNRLLIERMGVASEVISITDPWHALKYILDNYHKNAIPENEGADLIFLDLNMPGMDGFTILDDMNTLNIDRSRIFTVILTSSISPEDRQKAITYGDQIKGYLTKPLKKEDVESIMATL